MDFMILVAGKELYDSIQAEKERTVPKNGPYFQSEPLCEFQKSVSRRGIIGAEIVLSNYGYSVRYDSGLQDWGLLASSRSKQVDGTIEDAVKFAERWVAQDPERRYAWRRKEKES